MERVKREARHEKKVSGENVFVICFDEFPVSVFLFIPGTVLCVVGIWSQTYLYVGLAVLGLDLILSIVEQVRIRNAAVGQSENPDFNEMMDAFCGQGGLRAAGKMFDEKLGFNHVDESQNKKN